MQPDAFDQILSRAANGRALIPDIAGGGTDAFRIVDGPGDGIPDVFIDTYAGHWLVQTRDAPFPERFRAGALPEGCVAVWWKELTNAESRREAPKWVAGSKDTAVVARENEICYAIDFASGYSQGIFLDQRDNRQWLRRCCSPGQEVLNLFAYTCAFSVVAAHAGARTTSVDLSASYLEWGKRNFVLNGVDCNDDSNHRFYKWDALDFLKKASRKKERYAFIVCDPPTFSRNKSGRVFRVEKEYAGLILRCAEVLAPGGTILCSSNHKALSQRRFVEMVRAGVCEAGRRIDELQVNRMPADFTGDQYLKSLRLRVT